MKKVTFDFETRSACELKKCGAYKYSLHPSTRPTCLAFKIKGHPTVYFLPFHVVNRHWRDHDENLKSLWIRFINEGYLFTGHNAFFERCIYTNVLMARYGWPEIPVRMYRCTAAKAAACAIPRSLEGAGEVMRLVTRKDWRGHAAMMATCKPTPQWNAWKKAVADLERGVKLGPRRRAIAEGDEPPLFLEPEAAPLVWKTLYDYCKTDVRAEELLDDSLPDLIPQEQEVWHFNQKLNWRGLTIDRSTVEKIVHIMKVDGDKNLAKLDVITMGLVSKPGAIRSILEFLELEGVKLPNLQSKTIQDELEGFGLTDNARDLLEIRKALSLASTKKYQSMLDRLNEDDRARDLSMYHAASTGRDGGMGINPYNFPRGLMKIDPDRPYSNIENVVECDAQTLRLLYGENLGILFSSLLRNMITASKGKILFVADFSVVEVAVLWWLAGHEKGLDVLRSGKDPYKYMAAANMGVSYDEISSEGFERQLGKAQVLGCGFRMGWKKFQATAFNMYRLKLTSRQSLEAVKNYRKANAPVADLWNDYENAAVHAVRSGKPVKAGKCTFRVERGFLWIKLPSGRSLAYREPEIVKRAITYTALMTHPHTGEETEVEKTSEPKDTVQFLGLDKSKKKLQVEFTHGGILTENIVQATARDLMMPALLRFEKKGYEVLLSVYDEGVCEIDEEKGSMDDFIKTMCESPAWAPGLPIKAKGFTAYRYRK